MACAPDLVANWLEARLPTLLGTARAHLPQGTLRALVPVVDAEDILMLAAAKVWRHWHTCRDPETGGPCTDRQRLSWARKVVQNEARTWMRANALRQHLRAESFEQRFAPTDERYGYDHRPRFPEPAAPAGGEDDPHAQAVEREADARTEALLRQATPLEARVARLRLDGHDFQEIGRRIGRNDEAARQLMTRARARLRALLEADGPHAAGAGAGTGPHEAA